MKESNQPFTFAERRYQALNKTVAIVIVSFIVSGLISSCKIYDDSPFNGNYIRTYPVNSASAGDTAYLIFSKYLKFQLALSNFQNGVGFVYTVLGSGTYEYADTQVVFSFQTGPNSPNECIGTPGIYSYRIINGVIQFNTMSDSCDANLSQPRSSIISGTWLQQ